MEWTNPRPPNSPFPQQPHWYCYEEDEEEVSELQRSDRFVSRGAMAPPPAIPPLKFESSSMLNSTGDSNNSSIMFQSLSSHGMPQLEESTEFQPFFSPLSGRYSDAAYLTENQLQQQSSQYSGQFNQFPSAMTTYYPPLPPPGPPTLLTRSTMDYNSEGAGIPTFHNTHCPVPTLPSTFGSLQQLPQTILEDRNEDFSASISHETTLSVTPTDSAMSLHASVLPMNDYADQQSSVMNTPPEYSHALLGPDKRGRELCAPFTEMTTSLEPKFSPDKRKLCCVEGCTSQARAFNRCKRHGGSKRCSSPGCTKSVQSRGLCIRHGGGSRCQEPGCGRASQSHGRCKMHGGGRPCIVMGCEKKAHLKRLCRKHGGGAKCCINGCDKWAQRQGMCMTHSKMVTTQPSPLGESFLEEQKSSSPASAAGSSPPPSLQFFSDNVPV